MPFMIVAGDAGPLYSVQLNRNGAAEPSLAGATVSVAICDRTKTKLLLDWQAQTEDAGWATAQITVTFDAGVTDQLTTHEGACLLIRATKAGKPRTWIVAGGSTVGFA